jgi:hypothetical protein
MGVVGGDFLLRKTLKKVEKRSCFEICWGLGAISNTSPTLVCNFQLFLVKHVCTYYQTVPTLGGVLKAIGRVICALEMSGDHH